MHIDRVYSNLGEEELKLREYFKQKKKVKEIKNTFKILVRELQLFNKLEEYPKDLTIKFIKYGFELKFNIAGICSFKTLENNLDFIKNCFRAYSLKLENNRAEIKMTIYSKPLENLNYIKYPLSNYELLLGFNYDGAITTDNRVSPHTLITGLSLQGKTMQLKTILMNFNDKVDIYILNSLRSDFEGIQRGVFINGEEEIYKFLIEFKAKYFTDQVDKKAEKRIKYVVFEELMTLSENKKIQKLIKEYLCVCRHYETYIIATIQVCRAEDFKAKTFFNNRISFKQMDKSSYGVALGSTAELEDLKQREFYCKGSNGLQKGRTYTLEN